jgi:hypothetical protein
MFKVKTPALTGWCFSFLGLEIFGFGLFWVSACRFSLLAYLLSQVQQHTLQAPSWLRDLTASALSPVKSLTMKSSSILGSALLTKNIR